MKFYCGADYFPKWLRRILSFPLNPVCYLHDLAYEDKDRYKIIIDLKFLAQCVSYSVKNIAMGTLGLLLAPIYFIAVLCFGRRSWLGSSN